MAPANPIWAPATHSLGQGSMFRYICTLTSEVENKAREVRTKLSLKMMPRKGNVVPGSFKQGLSVSQAKLRFPFQEPETKHPAPHVSISPKATNLTRQK